MRTAFGTAQQANPQPIMVIPGRWGASSGIVSEAALFLLESDFLASRGGILGTSRFQCDPPTAAIGAERKLCSRSAASGFGAASFLTFGERGPLRGPTSAVPKG